MAHGHTALAQSQPERSVGQGQNLEEDITLRRYANHPAVDAFISEMAARHDFDAHALRRLFARARYSATSAKQVMPVASPEQQRNWHVYRSSFLDEKRIRAGVRFWRAHQAVLRRADRAFGVPPEIIVAIIGVESFYGHQMGNFHVLDALTTLAFDYPPAPNRLERARLFRQNLEDFLVWTRDIGLDPTRVLGSYAGAIGMPQFMPSNILQYARSDEPNRPPELTGAADSILSIAHYLRRYGWEAGRPVVWNIGVDSGSQRIAQATADGRPEPHHTLGQLLQAGLLLNKAFLDLRAELDTPVTVVDLPTPGQPVEYWLGLCNFYILTRYNKSFFYAAAVYQLSQRLKQRFKPAMTQNLFKSSQNS
ncbi:Murein transglycosylase domain protein [Candidatus Glomeribacter gigasporarum BEG34]|uniref:Murein transglycosylase domain protein n=1 Tax=Candidatus Glomeribacter gigasporarum BEG34 TaxID=1070319 RepID=G2JAN1_9BURK|nr:Murein transglycosylase domain protein [Candidatus Glomeribacter gigasporarum BEG34]